MSPEVPPPRHSDVMQVEQALSRCRGIAYTHQLFALGVSKTAIAHALDAGHVVRLRKGVVAFESDSSASVAAWHGGSVTCVSALRQYGVWLLPHDDEHHVHVPSGSRIHRHPGCNCITHRTPGRRAFGFLPVREALVHSARCLSDEAFFAAFESAWFRRLLSRADRAWVRARVPARLRKLIDMARPDAESGLESILRLRLLAIGIHLSTQVSIPLVGRVDFLIDHLIIEVDGRLGHAEPSSRHKDLVRDARAAEAGYRTLRFDYALVIHDWPQVLAAILAALHQS